MKFHRHVLFAPALSLALACAAGAAEDGVETAGPSPDLHVTLRRYQIGPEAHGFLLGLDEEFKLAKRDADGEIAYFDMDPDHAKRILGIFQEPDMDARLLSAQNLRLQELGTERKLSNMRPFWFPVYDKTLFDSALDAAEDEETAVSAQWARNDLGFSFFITPVGFGGNRPDYAHVLLKLEHNHFSGRVVLDPRLDSFPQIVSEELTVSALCQDGHTLAFLYGARRRGSEPDSFDGLSPEGEDTAAAWFLTLVTLSTPAPENAVPEM
jgi:hypothetical protein